MALDETGRPAEERTDKETDTEAEAVEGKLAEVAVKACTAGTGEPGQKLVSQTVWMGSQPEAAAQQCLGTKLESQGTMLGRWHCLKRGWCSEGSSRLCSYQSVAVWRLRKFGGSSLESKMTKPEGHHFFGWHRMTEGAVQQMALNACNY